MIFLETLELVHRVFLFFHYLYKMSLHTLKLYRILRRDVHSHSVLTKFYTFTKKRVRSFVPLSFLSPISNNQEINHPTGILIRPPFYYPTENRRSDCQRPTMHMGKLSLSWQKTKKKIELNRQQARLWCGVAEWPMDYWKSLFVYSTMDTKIL